MGFKARPERDHRLFKPHLGGGSLLDLGIYPIFLALLLLGLPDTIKAIGTLSDEGSRWELLDTISLIGIKQHAILESTLLSSNEIPAEITGEKGIIQDPESLVWKISRPWSWFEHRGKVGLFYEWILATALQFEAEEAANASGRGKNTQWYSSPCIQQSMIAVMDHVRKQIHVTYEMYEWYPLRFFNHLIKSPGCRMTNNVTIFQFFHWYYSPEGNLWKHAIDKAPHLAQMGITHVWLPPAYKSGKGMDEPGYAAYDLYDLGEFDQKGTVRTRYAPGRNILIASGLYTIRGMQVMADVVLNHKKFWRWKGKCTRAAGECRQSQWTHWWANNDWSIYAIHVSQRNNKYSEFIWDWHCFTGMDEDNRIYIILNEAHQRSLGRNGWRRKRKFWLPDGQGCWVFAILM